MSRRVTIHSAASGKAERLLRNDSARATDRALLEIKRSILRKLARRIREQKCFDS
jgi:hypothetical protein